MWNDEEDDYCLPSGQGSPPPSGYVRPSDLMLESAEVRSESPLNSLIADTAWLNDLPSTSTSMGNYFLVFVGACIYVVTGMIAFLGHLMFQFLNIFNVEFSFMLIFLLFSNALKFLNGLK